MESAHKSQKKEEEGERIVIGVNKFRPEEEVEPVLFRVDPKVEEEQAERLKRFRAERDQKRVATLLQKVREVASGPENLIPALIEAVEDRAILG